MHRGENGFWIAVMKPDDAAHDQIVRGFGPALAPGMRVDCTGVWTLHPKYGRQFAADVISRAIPKESDGLKAFLQSDLIRGIGPVMAQRLIDAFGADLPAVLRDTPERLSEVKGMSAKRIEMLLSSWAEQTAQRDVLIFLEQFRITPGKAMKIFKAWGKDTLKILKANPYRLTELRGFGFKTADEIGIKMGIEPDSPFRLKGGLTAMLQEAEESGSCCLPDSELVSLTAEALSADAEAVLKAMKEEIADGHLVRETVSSVPLVALPELHRAEESIAEDLARLSEAAGLFPFTEDDVTETASELGIALSDEQKNAVMTALQNRVSVITGGPGVGKTLTVRVLLAVMRKAGIRHISLCAPTGRAAKRMEETSGEHASTIHRLLGFKGSHFIHCRDFRLLSQVVIADETSMLDVRLAAQLLEAVPDHATVVFVGDADQLPPVGPGLVLSDIIASGTIPVAKLTKVYRQAAQSRIISAAHAINRGIMPDLVPDPNGDFFFSPAYDPDEAADRIVKYVSANLPRYYGFNAKRDIQVLSPMQKTPTGVRALNERLQNALNPAKGGPVLKRFEGEFRIGDKIMQTANNYDKGVFNGDIGIVTAIDPKKRRLTAAFDTVTAEYEPDEIEDLTLAYAITIHKSQGSEMPCVVIPVTTQHYVMLERNLIYTGVTRGRKLVALVGQEDALELAVHRISHARRTTTLANRLLRKLPQL